MVYDQGWNSAASMSTVLVKGELQLRATGERLFLPESPAAVPVD